jgi:hypothetical protein
MTESKDVGKDLGKVKRETKNNAKRVKPNFPASQRSVDNLNLYNTYRKEFSIGEGATASLNLDIQEMPAPCTVTPPRIESYIETTWAGEWMAGPCGGWNETGQLFNWHCTKIGTNTNDEYVVITRTDVEISSTIYLPYDGCYLIEFTWGAYGLSYFQQGYIDMGVSKFGRSDPWSLGAGADFTGVIAIMGPSLHYMPSPSRLIGMVEAKEGDSITCTAHMGGFSKCYPWFGTHLRGMASPGEGSLKITLVATAEDILTLREQNDLSDPNAPVHPRLTERVQCNYAQDALQTLDWVVDFYYNLSNKGQVPYPNESWSTEEQWDNYFASAWYGAGWAYQSPSGSYPWPAPHTIDELLAYQATWSTRVATCPSLIERYDQDCITLRLINKQLTLLQDQYYETNGLGVPFYIYIEGSTEPEFFTEWSDFWAWVWDRGYNMETSSYDRNFLWTEEVHNLYGLTPWPPPTTIAELEAYVASYKSDYSGSGCR